MCMIFLVKWVKFTLYLNLHSKFFVLVIYLFIWFCSLSMNWIFSRLQKETVLYIYIYIYTHTRAHLIFTSWEFWLYLLRQVYSYNYILLIWAVRQFRTLSHNSQLGVGTKNQTFFTCFFEYLSCWFRNLGRL